MTERQDLNRDEDSVAAWIADLLAARGIDRVFGLQGGHIQPVWDHLGRRGILIVDVRDEGAAVHMAHAHSELTGTLGVAMVTAGPGGTNADTIDVINPVPPAHVQSRIGDAGHFPIDYRRRFKITPDYVARTGVPPA